MTHPIKTHTQIASQMFQPYLRHPAVLVQVTPKGLHTIISSLKTPSDLSTSTIKSTLKSEIKSHNKSIIVR